MRLRSIAIGFTLLILLSACSADARVTIVADSQGCMNPTLEHDGRFWETSDLVPMELSDQELEGVLTLVGDDQAIFRASGGVELRYEAAGEWSSMHCASSWTPSS